MMYNKQSAVQYVQRWILTSVKQAKSCRGKPYVGIAAVYARVLIRVDVLRQVDTRVVAVGGRPQLQMTHAAREWSVHRHLAATHA